MGFEASNLLHPPLLCLPPPSQAINWMGANGLNKESLWPYTSGGGNGGTCNMGQVRRLPPAGTRAPLGHGSSFD